MRFERVIFSGMGAFSKQVEIDLSSVPGPLCAVVGANGSGKSTVLEMLPGALYRKTATRGTLASLATARDSFVEVHVVHGDRYVVRQTMDAASGKGEALIMDANGQPLIDSGKRRDFDNWIAEHMPRSEVLYASMFSAQGSGGFLDLDPTPRKAVLLRVLGHEHLEGQSKEAGELAREAKGLLETCSARLTDEVERGCDVAIAKDELKAAVGLRELAERAEEIERRALKEVVAANGAHRVSEEMWQRHAITKQQFAERSQSARDTCDRLTSNWNAWGSVLDRAEEIERDADVLEALTRRLSECQSRENKVSVDVDGATQLREQLLIMLNSADAQNSEAAERMYEHRKFREVLEKSNAKALKELPDAKARHKSAADNEASAMAKLGELRGLREDGDGARLERLRGGLVAIADNTVDDARHCARVALDLDTETARALDHLPDDVVAANEQLASAKLASVATYEEILCLKNNMASRGEVDRVSDLIAASEIRHVETKCALDDAHGACLTHQTVYDEAKVIHAEAAAQSSAARDAMIGAPADECEALEKARAASANMEGQIAAAAKERDAMEAKEAALMEPVRNPKPATSDDVARHSASVARDASRAAASEVASATAALARANDSAARVGQLRAERDGLQFSLSDWRILESGLGRNGIQALEVDGAGPELTELANDLLRTCLGSRFSVSIETTRQSADGRKQLEGCWVMVLDSASGREAEAQTFSGGERVMIGEAINLAITMRAARSAGLEGPTLVRDETGAALSPKNGEAYVAMLRRAAEIVGAPHVFFVAHNERLQDLADSKMIVENGTVTIK